VEAAAASSVSASIYEPADSAVTRYGFKLTLRGADGQPVPGQDLTVTLVGDGSLAPGFSAKEVKRETDAQGSAVVTWYRRSIFGRDVKATLSIEVPRPDWTLTLENVDPHDHGPRISYAGTRLR
jgi:hypothetical protein